MDNTWIEYLINNSSAYASFLLEMDRMMLEYTIKMKEALVKGDNHKATLCASSELAIDELKSRVVLYQQEKATQAIYAESVKK